MIVILGAKGMVGQQLVKLMPDAVAFDREALDVTDFPKLKSELDELGPEVVINCVAFNDVDGAETKVDQAYSLNQTLVEKLVEITNEQDAVLVHFSTGYVFDGKSDGYNEDATPHPLSVYAKSKFAGEQAVVNGAKKYYLVRTNAIFGPPGESEKSKKSFVNLMLGLAEEMTEVKVIDDEKICITYAPELAQNVVRLLKETPTYGIYHLSNEGSLTWFDFAKEIFSLKNIKVEVKPVGRDEFFRPAKRPANCVINNTKLPKLRPWQEALKEYLSI